MTPPGTAIALALVVLLGCASPTLRAAPDERPDYLRYVAFEAPGNEHLLLRWPTRQMPLRIFLPPPPAGLFEDPAGMRQAAKDGIEAWRDVVRPGLPAFVYVERAGDAHFPIAWTEAQPGIGIAHCFLRVNPFQRRFDVAQIVVTGRHALGELAPLALVRSAVLHEVGHALGLGGHSPNPGDAMYGTLDAPMTEERSLELTDRDRETLRQLYEKPIGTRIRAPRRAF